MVIIGPGIVGPFFMDGNMDNVLNKWQLFLERIIGLSMDGTLDSV